MFFKEQRKTAAQIINSQNNKLLLNFGLQPSKALDVFVRFTGTPTDLLSFIYRSNFAVASAGISILDSLASVSDSSLV